MNWCSGKSYSLEDSVNVKSVELIPQRSPRVSPILIAGFFLVAVVGCGKKEEPKPEAKPAEVFVVKIEPRDTPIDLEYVAQTQSSQQVEIRARVNGFLDKRVYTEGTVVKEGQVLFLMDKKPFQAQVAERKGKG